MQRPLSSRGNSHARKPRITLRPRQRMGWRMAYTVTSCFIVLATIGSIIFFQFAKVGKAYATATSGDYQTVKSGNWNSTSTWQKYNGTSWVAATTTPSTTGIISIQNGDTVTVTASVTVDSLFVNAGGTL